MSRNWSLVLIAGLFEISWVIGLKHAGTALEWIGTAFSIVFSMYLLILSTKKLPVGTAYAVFTGIGTAGTVLTEMLIFNEPVKLAKILLILLLLAGVVGLKTITKEHEVKEEG